MRVVPTTKTFRNPERSHRLVYLAEPFIDRPLYFPSNSSAYSELYETTRNEVHGIFPPLPEDAEYDPRPQMAKRFAQLRGMLELERIYHESLASRLDRLRDKVVVYIPGITSDQTDETLATPSRIGIDPMSDRNKLSAEIARISQELSEEFEGAFPVESIVYWPIAPVAFPFYVNTRFQVVHFDQAAVELANEEMQKKGKLTFGATVKTRSPRFRRASSKFSESVYDSAEAVKVYPDYGHESLQRAATFNRDIQANVMRCIIPVYTVPHPNHPVGRVNVFAKRGSYVFDIMDKARAMMERDRFHIGFGDINGVMRNTQLSREGECDPRALNILKGFLYNTAMELTPEMVVA